MIDFNGDLGTVYAHCLAAQASGQLIDDATARVIASQYHDGGDDTYGFVSTGTITNPENMRRDFVQYIDMTGEDSVPLDALYEYLRHHGTRGPVDGWSKLWVR